MQFNPPPPSRRQADEVSYWISYSDLMAALLLVFILLLIGSLIISKDDIEKQQALIEETIAELELANQDLQHLDENLSSILGVRTAIITRLGDQLSESNTEILFDDATGAVQLGSGILFDEGSAVLSEEGKKALDALIPVYFRALLSDDDLRDYVGQIVFEGHTNSNYSGSSDPSAAYLFNLRLSQDRAYAAMEYVIANGVGDEYDAKSLLAAVGYSSSRLIHREGEPGVEDEERSRRIEIRFRLKDEESMEELRRLIAEERRFDP